MNARVLRSSQFILRNCATACVSLLPYFVALPALAQPKDEPERIVPWSRPDDVPSAQSPRELLELYEISLDELKSIKFSGPDSLSNDQLTTLARLVYRLARLDPNELNEWRQQVTNWQQIAAEIDRKRGEIFPLQGSVTHIIHIGIPAELHESLEFQKLYDVTLQLDSGQTVHVLAHHVPPSWLSAETLPTRAAADALLLQATGEAEWLFAAGRLAWFPERALPEHGIGPSHVRLGQLGVDCGLLESLRESNHRELVSEDREIFYQMLAAAAAQNTGQMADDLYSKFDLEQLLIAPHQHQGQLMKFAADARRITWIAIEDEDIRERYQLKGYYEVDITLPLNDRPIRLRGANNKDGPIYEYKYPATVCVVRLPPELQELAIEAATQADSQPLIRKRVNIAGYFFKVWTHPTRYVAQFDPRQMHLSPLFLGTTLESAPPAKPPRNIFTPAFAALFVAGLLVGAWAMWRTRSRDQAVRRTMPKKIDIPSGPK